jgi:hypothetical protein
MLQRRAKTAIPPNPSLPDIVTQLGCQDELSSARSGGGRIRMAATSMAGVTDAQR